MKFRNSLTCVAAGGCMLLIALSSAVSAGPGRDKEDRGVGGNPAKVCQGDQKIEGRGNHNYNAGDGTQIAEVCIKAGQPKYLFKCGETDGCYTLEWGDNCESVSISGGGTSRHCKDISHTTVTFGPGECQPQEEICNNDIDDDCDGKVDDDDEDCTF